MVHGESVQLLVVVIARAEDIGFLLLIVGTAQSFEPAASVRLRGGEVHGRPGQIPLVRLRETLYRVSRPAPPLSV